MLARASALVRDHPLLTPLFIVYAAINVIAGIFVYTPWLAPVNWLLLVAYVSVIHSATRGRQLAMPDAPRPNARSRDFGLATTVAVLQLAAVAVVWFLIIPHGLPRAWAADLRAAGLPTLIAGKAANVALTIPLLLLPTLVAVAFFRVRARDVGLSVIPRDLALGVGLAALGVGLALVSVAAGARPGLLWQSASLPIVAATTALQSLSNGVPEELAFRGVIFGRLMPWLGRPGNSLVLSTMVWGLFHVPTLVVGSGVPIWLAPFIGLIGALPGLIYGYLFYRTRSIWPGAIWHTSNTSLGLMFL
jgi:membrane protease YdiL (CAAX protease family)